MGHKQVWNEKEYTPKTLTGIYEPSGRMLAGDTSDRTQFEGHCYFRYQNVGDRHQNKINVLIADGSAESVKSTTIQSNNNSKWWNKDASY